VWRRLLNDLEQGIETLARHHMGFVEHEDLVTIPGRREDGLLTQITRVIDTTMGGRIDFHHIKGTAAASTQFLATRAFTAGLRGGSLFAVQAARQDAGTGGLAAAARAGEQIGM
jgi:hypothetical protein